MARKLDIPPQVILEGIPKPYVVIDRDYRILAANRRYAEQFEIPLEELFGRRCHEVEHHSEVPCRQLGQECPLDRAVADRHEARLVNLHPDARGRDRPMQVTATPILGEDGEVAMVGALIEPLEGADAEAARQAPRVLVGQSRALLRLTSLLYRAAPTQTTILIEGESGVGKECVASFIHNHSSRSTGPFVVVDCGALGESLIESELFGYEKGAFTGATQRKVGLIESANGGTLFIDEIGELPLELQTKLLRVLETGTLRRLGGTEYLRVDVRFIAATHRNLLQMVDEGRFRQDLYYRLAAFPVTIPPLRERKEDIPALAEYFLGLMEEGERQLPLSSEVIEALLAYDYPGNIRELRNILERAAILAVGEQMRPEHLIFPSQLSVQRQGSDVTVVDAQFGAAVQQETNMAAGMRPSAGADDNPLMSRRRRLDDSRVLEALRMFDGHRGRAAQALGVSERTLYRYIRRMRKEQQPE
ncbi:MAG: PAS domain-containing protein [Gammaproteobacteria bacterium]|nr:MAG: PAS domain-containing protein [Gammaproteobacteria bacterium]